MRYYFIDDENNEYKIDLSDSKRISPHLIQFEMNYEGSLSKVFLRSLAGKYFISFDNLNWQKIVPLGLVDKVLHIDKHLKSYRGYKPSGIGQGAEGELITQIPGKVVKVFVKEGDEIKEGDQLLILEAMKMENEIKAPTSGTVTKIHIKEGQNLEVGVLMMEIE